MGYVEQNEEQNKFYATEDRCKEKDSFRFVLDLIGDTNGKSLCDVACATGDFLSFAKRNAYFSRICGYDINESFLQLAKEDNPDITFEYGDIEKGIGNKFDVVTNFGMIYLFEDWAPIIDNLLSMVEKGGILIIHEEFNKYGFHVKHEYSKKIGDHEIRFIDWVAPISDISEWLEKKKIRYEWIPFEMKTEINPNPNNYARTWTIRTEEGRLLRVDGVGRVKDEYALVIHP